ncbi:type II toxin-antitoxin system HipA family toxin [Desulfosudis oleivorans]|uniref:HipA domain protein n=1 Tax=Desulfosudis oleivorans (strain DSM 6200 / JCM 39069 / Hxd3) TaxID=96561 RepID=A8ZVZ7_DESOH|nr:HipA domain-containing protein [Desulfosudis oleivorans]ABW66706.1 HipA domain protein [Desulfosudis oleivorans Hxd3]
MIRLDVWLTVPSGKSIKAGSLVVADPDTAGGGRLRGQFRYNPEYLERPEAFALDPLNLPLSAEIFDANRPRAGVHGVFEDSLPDDWGRRLMIRRYNLKRDEQRVPNLLRLLGGKGLGALGYAEEGSPGPETTSVSSRYLQELALLAEKFEQDPAAATDDEFSLLFQAGSSPGGARPKVLVADENGSYLAKFASAGDRLDVVSLEAAAMELARRAGIDTAGTRLVPLGTTGKCLLVKRFDINAAGGRNHLVSMQTLLRADDYYNAGYRDLAEVIRHISSQPAHDLHRLYRQMVFNVLIGNTDDHLKNFLMLHDETGWRLSPAFDLIPNIGFNREHVLRIGLDSRPPDFETLLAESKYFGIKRRQEARNTIMEINAAVMEWPGIFKKCHVPARDADSIGKDIMRRTCRTPQ